jgi:SAM-dependent methyltransferase
MEGTVAKPGTSKRWALRRVARDLTLRVRHPRDHIAYYRAVMQDTTAAGEVTAVGNSERPAWRRAGRLQFDYLIRHGLTPEWRMLEIGCGNLRAGWRFIEFLEPGNYHGLDISPNVLAAARETLQRHGLTDRGAHLELVADMQFADLPPAYFDVVHAHSVFSHSPLPVIEEAFRHVSRVLKPDGFFDFTFNRTEGRERNVLREDFYYRTESLCELAERCGLRAEFMTDWEAMNHRQQKIRVRPRDRAVDRSH